jgi:putative transposase
VRDRIELVDKKYPTLSVTKQCKLLSVSRSSSSYKLVGLSAEDFHIIRLLDELYLIDPCLGSRRLVVVLRREHSIICNRKRLQRLRRINLSATF